MSFCADAKTSSLSGGCFHLYKSVNPLAFFQQIPAHDSFENVNALNGDKQGQDGHVRKSGEDYRCSYAEHPHKACVKDESNTRLAAGAHGKVAAVDKGMERHYSRVYKEELG